ncbi:MAG: ATP-binding protein, partial [Gemmatimonadaceae bacterium]
LVWLASQLVQQDRALERERGHETLTRVASAVTTALQHRIAAAKSSLNQLASLPASERRAAMARMAPTLGPGAALVEFTSGGITVAPTRALLYDPAAPIEQVETPPALARGEWLEFRERDLRRAASAYRAHTSAPDPAVRGAALLRLARVLWKDGRADEALQTYDLLGALDTVSIHGLPAGLLAAHARLGVRRDQGRRDEARIEADSLVARLASRRWRLSRGSFEFYHEEALRARGAVTSPDKVARPAASALAASFAEALLLSRAVDSLWRAWSDVVATPVDARYLLTMDSVPVLVLRSARAGATVMLISTPAHLRAAWIEPLQPILAGEGVTLSLSDAAGPPIFPPEPAPAATLDAPRLTHAAAVSRLPWTLGVAITDPRALSRDFAARRRVLLFSLVVAILLVLVGTYSVTRAVNRELAVARLQSDFVAAVSHEFRTPLTSMRQVAELLDAGRVSSDERRTQYHAVLRREGDRLHRLVENLLDFGRMEAGAREFRFEPVDAAALVTEVVEEFRNGVATSGYEVVLSAADAGPVHADREALTRALWNLLDNAVKYSPEHKTIDVSVARDNGRVVMSVSDHGLGIPPEEHGAIFQEFVRGQAARVSGVRGTGIGLAMVRHIVQAHGGEIRFTSIVGAGSTFSIRLAPAPA